MPRAKKTATRKIPTKKTTRKIKDDCVIGVAVGMHVHQGGYHEGSLLFDPLKPEQAKHAIGVAVVKPEADHVGRAQVRRRLSTASCRRELQERPWIRLPRR